MTAMTLGSTCSCSNSASRPSNVGTINNSRPARSLSQNFVASSCKTSQVWEWNDYKYLNIAMRLLPNHIYHQYRAVPVPASEQRISSGLCFNKLHKSWTTPKLKRVMHSIGVASALTTKTKQSHRFGKTASITFTPVVRSFWTCVADSQIVVRQKTRDTICN